MYLDSCIQTLKHGSVLEHVRYDHKPATLVSLQRTVLTENVIYNKTLLEILRYIVTEQHMMIHT